LIFVHSVAQEDEARTSGGRLVEIHRRPLVTEIVPYSGFNRAEGFHQKYRLRLDPFLMKAFRDRFPDERAFVDSTAAARVNGFLAGFGNPSICNREVPLWGLSGEAWERLRRIAAGRL
jgi:peptide-methionine (S)-S-oxide reductase